ncbi:MAG: CAP domain-containing protein [Patescibacteria group bacterium]
MRLASLGLFLFTMVIVVFGAPALIKEYPQIGAVIASVLVEGTNFDRTAQGLPPLTYSESLTKIAQMKANDMATKEYFAHVSPEGVTPWYWFQEGGYTFTYAGENLAVDFTESTDVERAWMNSPKHRENILGAQFTEVGIATAVGTYEGRPTVFVAQMFGAPARVETVATKPVPKRVQPIIEPENAAVPAIATTEQISAESRVQAPILGESANSVLATEPTLVERWLNVVFSWLW